jgi:hypothetical protein
LRAFASARHPIPLTRSSLPLALTFEGGREERPARVCDVVVEERNLRLVLLGDVRLQELLPAETLGAGDPSKRVSQGETDREGEREKWRRQGMN